MNTTENPNRLFDIVAQSAGAHSRRTCFRYKGASLSAEGYAQAVDKMACALLAHGMERGEAVAIIAPNSPRWNIVDMAIMKAGGVTLPLCPGLTAEEYTECMHKAGVRILFLGDEDLRHRFRLILPQVESLVYVVLLEGEQHADNYETWCGIPATSEQKELLYRRQSLVTTDDLCCLTYTGGGTYSRLTHRFVLTDVLGRDRVQVESRGSKVGREALCTLHGRSVNYSAQWHGVVVEYEEG